MAFGNLLAVVFNKAATAMSSTPNQKRQAAALTETSEDERGWEQVSQSPSLSA